MGEEISRFMDGELEDGELETACARLKQADGMTTWVCYHVIGDALRGTTNCAPGFGSRFWARLAHEPTVLAPRTPSSRPVAYGWAAAAGVAAVALVGWVAFGTLQNEPAAIVKARDAATARAPAIGAGARAIPADYLIAHQEYSPTTQIQGVGPHLRSVAVPAAEARP